MGAAVERFVNEFGFLEKSPRKSVAPTTEWKSARCPTTIRSLVIVRVHRLVGSVVTRQEWLFAPSHGQTSRSAGHPDRRANSPRHRSGAVQDRQEETSHDLDGLSTFTDQSTSMARQHDDDRTLQARYKLEAETPPSPKQRRISRLSSWRERRIKRSRSRSRSRGRFVDEGWFGDY